MKQNKILQVAVDKTVATNKAIKQFLQANKTYVQPP